MSDINLVLLSGRLREDPELRYARNGTPYAQVMLDLVRETEAGPVTAAFALSAWGRMAERLAVEHRGGDAVMVQGAMRNRRTEGPAGATWRTEIDVREVQRVGERAMQPAATGSERVARPADGGRGGGALDQRGHPRSPAEGRGTPQTSSGGGTGAPPSSRP